MERNNREEEYGKISDCFCGIAFFCLLNYSNSILKTFLSKCHKKWKIVILVCVKLIYAEIQSGRIGFYNPK